MSENLQLDPDISLEELTAKAEGGHKFAQYLMSKYNLGVGEEKKAVEWMTKSADNDFPPALVEMGMWHLLGHIVENSHEKAIGYLQKGVDADYSFALRIMGILYALGFAVEKEWEKGVDHMVRAADKEEANSLRQIGFLIRTNKGLKAFGDKMIKRAASLNDPVALALLGKQPDQVEADEIPENWDKWPEIKAFLLTLPAETDYASKDMNAEPVIKMFGKALAPEECLYLREMARPSLTENVQLLGGRPEDPDYQELQTNRCMVFYPIVQDMVTILLARRLAKLADVPFEQAELLVVHHYAEGQEFKPHVDYMNPELTQHAYSIQQSGQRVKSVFAHLNEGYEGGETDFPKAGLKVVGKEGDVLVLENVNSIGLPDEKSENASLPVTKGEKWLAALWIRDKAQA